MSAKNFASYGDLETILTGFANAIKSKPGILYADNPIGSIVPYGGATAPSGWFLCQGQAVSRTTYADLFAAIGTSFGAGDGSTTFNLPDLRETVPVGSGTRGSGVTDHDTYTVGQFKDDQLQEHTHNVICEFGAYPSPDMSPLNYDNKYCQVSGLGTDTRYPVDGTASTNTGRTGSTTHGKQLGVNYIIKAEHTPVPADFMDAVDEAVVENNNYSTTETVVGRWIDGKPIYRKVFTDIPLPEEEDIVQADRRAIKKFTDAFPANYISSIVSASFVAINRTYGNEYSLPRTWESSEPDTGESMVVSLNASIIGESKSDEIGYSFEVGSNRTSWNNTNYKVRAIIEYTKTTD